MIKITRVESIAQPFFVCDICGEKITMAGMGAALNVYDAKDDSSVDVVYVHKGKCHDEAENMLHAKSGAIPQWQELEKHLFWLLQNTGLSLVRLQEFAHDEDSQLE